MDREPLTSLLVATDFVILAVVLKSQYGPIAQLGEHLPCKQEVVSSTLTGSTKCKYSITVSISAFQADGASSILAICSIKN